MNQYRCETCKDILCKCNPKQEGIQFSPNWIFTRRYGCASHNDFKDEQHKLDVDTLGTILNVMERDFDKLTTMERRAYSKAKSVELYLRQQEEHVKS